MKSFLASSQEKFLYTVTFYEALSYCPTKPEKAIQLHKQEVSRFFWDIQGFFLIPSDAGLLSLESLPSFMSTNFTANGV